MKSIACLIDGYNLYHAIDDSGKNHIKWLNLRKFSEELIKPIPEAKITEVHYFSAFATWKEEQFERHREYVSALRSVGVIITLGNFKKKPAKCNRCGAEWIKREEKESDVNLGLTLYRLASKNLFDEAMIVTGDTDLAAAIRLTKKDFPDKRITIVLPPRRQHAFDLISAADAKISTSIELLEKCLFPDVINYQGKIIKIPTKYRK
jgi:uncharacterized LabA/DUF88 family protein